MEGSGEVVEKGEDSKDLAVMWHLSPTQNRGSASHLPHLVDVHALVGWAGWGRLGERGGVEDSLGPGVHCGLKE